MSHACTLLRSEVQVGIHVTLVPVLTEAMCTQKGNVTRCDLMCMTMAGTWCASAIAVRSVQLQGSTSHGNTVCAVLASRSKVRRMHAKSRKGPILRRALTPSARLFHVFASKHKPLVNMFRISRTGSIVFKFKVSKKKHLNNITFRARTCITT